MKGTREPLLLIATGIFLVAFITPITLVLGSAGIALGMHDLRKAEAGPALGKLRVATAVLAWSCCAQLLASFAWERVVVLGPILLPGMLCCTALVLRTLARIDGAGGLARAFLVLGALALLVVPLGLLGLPIPMLVLHLSGNIALACLVLKLRARALPYGRRALQSPR